MSDQHSHKAYARDLLGFSIPMTLTAASAVVTTMIDSMMAGKLGVGQLAAVALASSVYFLFVILGRGMSQGLSPLLAGSVGKGDKEQSQILLSHNLIIQFFLGLLLTPVLYFVANNLETFGQPQETAEYAARYLNVMCFFLVPQYMMQVFRTGIESHGNSKFPMIASYVTAILNIFLNWLLIFGNWGFPRLELAGAALASGISNSALIFVFYFYLRSTYNMRGLSGLANGINKETVLKLAKIGGIFSFQWFIEVGAFSGSTIVLGLYSKLHLAAHQVVLNVATLAFMIPLGLGAAATIKVSGHLGHLGREKTRPIVKSYLLTCWAATVVTSIIILLVRGFVPELYTDNPEVISLAYSLLLVAAAFQFADGTQAVVSGILRGYLDIKVPTAVITVCWWGLTIPLGYYLTIVKGLGAYGMWYSLTFGLFCAAILLFVRLQKVVKLMG